MKRFLNSAAMAAVVVAMGVLSGCGDGPVTLQDKAQLIPASSIEKKQGTAIMLLIDTSSSMDSPPATGGRPKMETARAAALEVVRKAEAFVTAHPGRTVVLGVMKFSGSSQIIVPIETPSVSSAENAISRLTSEDSTAIGDAIFEAKRALDATGYENKHIIIVTDGENNRGRDPAAVAKTIYEQNELGAKMYVVGFDVDASVYAPMKSYANIYSASDAGQLETALGLVVTKISAEVD